MVLDTQNQNRKKPRIVNTEPTRYSNFGDISSVSGTRILDPMEHIVTCSNPSVVEMIEAIVHWTQKKYGIQEFISAKKEFHSLTGRVFPDEFFYHQRACYFLDYFIFQRPLLGSLQENDLVKTPFGDFLDSEECLKLPQDLNIKQKFHDLKNFQHSIYKILKLNKGKMYLRDLFTKEKLEIFDEHHNFRGFFKGSLIQGFMFNFRNSTHISQGLIIHPPTVLRFVKASINRVKKQTNYDKMKILSNLAKQNLNLIRQRHQDPKKVYSQDPR